MQNINTIAKTLLIVMGLMISGQAQAHATNNVQFSFQLQLGGNVQPQQLLNGFQFIWGGQNQHQNQFKVIKNKKKLVKYLQRNKLRQIRNVRRHGKFFTARVTNRRGFRADVRVNRFTGRILIKNFNRWRIYK